VSASDVPILYVVALGLVAVLAGGVAAVSGFGIGSLLTPILALQVDIRVAVAAVSIPHLIGTAQRFWSMRRDIDRGLLLEFGITSAAGGLVGALLHDRASTRGLTIIFGLLLLLAATADLTGWMRRVNWGPTAGWIAGALSGLLGGLVGNQGSIRTAGLLAYHVSPAAFVATATAVALFVDGARIPVYVATQGQAMQRLWPLLLVASAGVVIGTAIGTRVLRRMPERAFRRSVALLLATLGVAMLAAGLTQRIELTKP
jgi:hypothetical protein